MNSRTATAVAIAAVVVLGAIWAASRQEPATAPTPAATGSATAPATGTATGTAAGTTPATAPGETAANAPAAPPGDGCSQYTWDGASWICTSLAAGN